jgi:hypothetical protein
MAPDPETAALLARWREAGQAATPGEWYAEPNTGWGRVWVQIGRRDFARADCEPLFNVRTRGGSDEDQLREAHQREADAAFIVTARTAMPLLVGAVEAVLALHQSVDDGAGAQCKGCATHVTFTRWPCVTYRAITTALAGKEAGDGLEDRP